MVCLELQLCVEPSSCSNVCIYVCMCLNPLPLTDRGSVKSVGTCLFLVGQEGWRGGVYICACVFLCEFLFVR